ncbi:MAG: hypothetical protein IT168_27145 [Bryobacterales bacterium]|nr:hypothetical protein [Bryobacterales bacterium]
MRRLLLFLAPVGLMAMDLTRATVVVPANAAKRERKAAAVLVEEVARRSHLRWKVAQESASGGPAIFLSNTHKGPKDGYTVRADGSGVRIEGNDERGLLFGAGHLLRKMEIRRNSATIPDGLNVTTAPKVRLRGHQLGYRPKTNSYDAWTLPMWDQYIRDLALFGTNAVELIPPRSDDDDDSPHFPATKMETMIGMSKIADDYGLDLWIWYPALDADYSKPETVESALKEWAEVFRQLPRIDAVFVPGGDPGHTHPKYLMPLLEKQAASLRKFHPKAQMWVAPQGFSTEWLNEFYAIMRTEPKWLDGIVFGPQIRVSLKQLRKDIPARYPIRHYPDITHSLRSQYSVPNWDAAYQLTLHREPINPRPVDEAAIFHHTNAQTIGFITYSEGCNDDVNKFVWSGLGWDPQADVTDTLRDYSRLLIGADFAESFAQGLLALERNWRGPLATNEGVERTLAQFDAMDRQAAPAQLLNWRFQQAQYRAHYDAYTRRRLLYETELQNRAMDVLRSAGALGSVRAMADAEAILDRGAAERTAPNVRARVFELAEALFQSVRMQLSVDWYKAIDAGRGANLDFIDRPITDAPFLKHQFMQIRGMADEKERRAAINALVHRTDPGPGGFYDDLGNPSAQPHLDLGLPYGDDPAHLGSPLAAVHPRANEAWPMSWQSVAESRDDSPLAMRYKNLSPTAQYRIKLVYGGEDNAFEFRLVADGQYEIHGYRRREKPVKPIEFDIPKEATRDGELRLEFQRKPGAGGAGRAVQLAEVWLTPVQ